MASSSGARTLPLPPPSGHAAAKRDRLGPPRRQSAPAAMTTHALVFIDPGHFHAALTLRERHPLVHEQITVYASGAGRELTEFLALIEAFNRRPERPTAWKTVVRTSDDALAQCVKERTGDVAILAGRNDRKMAVARRLHDAGIHVLADKPWLTSPTALADVRHVLSGGARAMEI